MGISGMSLEYEVKRGPSQWQQKLFSIERNLKKAEDKSDAKRISKWSDEKRAHLAQPFLFDFFLGTSDIGITFDANLQVGGYGGYWWRMCASVSRHDGFTVVGGC